jgi:hypothetical protein
VVGIESSPFRNGYFEITKIQCGNQEVLAMRYYEDRVNESDLSCGEELDFEDLALIESIVGVLQMDEDKPDRRKSMEWEMDTLIDEF